MVSENKKGLSTYNKWKYTLITTFVFLIVTNPVTYVLMNNTVGKIVGISLSNSNGCPTVNGMVIHAIVFTLILRAIMG